MITSPSARGLSRIIHTFVILVLVLSNSLGTVGLATAASSSASSAFNLRYDANAYTYVEAVSSDPITTLDPALAYDTGSGETIQNVYETLVFFDGEETNTYVPHLADSYELSPDGLTWTFHIREGVTFHNGASLTASDVAYSFQRGLLQGGYSSPQLLLSEPFFGVGIDDISILVDPSGSIAGNRTALQAWDPVELEAACQQVKDAIVADEVSGTVTMHLAQPWGPFLATIVGTWGSIMDRDWTISHGGWDDSCHTWQDWYAMTSSEDPLSGIANGTGPFTLNHWTRDVEVVLTRHNNYWRAPAQLGRVEIKVVPDSVTRLNMLLTGAADRAAILTTDRPQADLLVGEDCVWDVPAGQYNCSVVNAANPLRRYIGRPGLSQDVILLNFSIATPEGVNPFIGSGQLDGNGIPTDFFSDEHIRKAFNHCFDWDAYSQAVFGGEFVRSITLPLEGMPGYDLNAPHYTHDLNQCETELGLADLDHDGIQSYLDTDDVTQVGFNFQLPYNEGNISRQTIAGVLSASFAQVDPRYVIQPTGMVWADYLAAQRAWKLPVMTAGWLEDIHDPHNWYLPYLTGVYAGRARIPEGMKAQYRALINQGLSVTDFAARHAIYQQLNQLVYDHAPFIILGGTTSHGFTQRRVSGEILNPLFPGIYYYPIHKTGDECTNVTEIPLAECEALVALYSSTDGANWWDNTGWLQTNTPCSWYGVVCDAGHVTMLELAFNQLAGVIPAELAGLTNISYLELSSNQLTGSILPELAGLTNLSRLEIGDNHLTGTIPPELADLTTLTRLGLGSNQLTGSIPPELAGLTNLSTLVLSYNQLTGTIPIELAGLSNLMELDLWGNQLTGSIPPELGGLTNLRFLSLANNQLSGSLPPELGGLTQLYLLTLSNNQFTGNLPVEIGNLTALEILYLGGNSLEGEIPSTFTNLVNLYELSLSCGLTSTDPAVISFIDGILGPGWDVPCMGPFTSCTAVWGVPQTECEALVALYNSTDGANWANNTGWLQTDMPCSWYGVTCDSGYVTSLELWDNQLSGVIPTELGGLTNLTYLSLSFNQLTGTIPPGLGGLTNLTFLDLCINQLIGNIPTELGSLINLTYLDLSENQLTASIPPELGGLTNLYFLNLAQNQLSGSIPPELESLTGLTNLYLHYNQLTGSIPSVFGSLINLNWLLLDHNQLTGSIPPELGSLSNLQSLSLGGNQLSGSIPPELENMTNLQALSLVNNQLTGSIPPELGNLTTLRILDLRSNQLSGSIPPELGGLTSLQGFRLSSNQISGTIPAELGSLINLIDLSLDNNQLIGNLPFEIGNLTNLEALNLAGNLLEGEIPSTITNLVNLFDLTLTCGLTSTDPAVISFIDGILGPGWDVACPKPFTSCTEVTEIPQTECEALVAFYDSTDGLNWFDNTGWMQTDQPCSWYGVWCAGGHVTSLDFFEDNNLTGVLPSELGNLTALTDIVIWNNNISGSIPSEIVSLTNLWALWLANTSLSGPIPDGIGNLTNLIYLMLDNNSLSGPIPDSIGNLVNLQYLRLGQNQLSGEIPSSITNLTQLTDLTLDCSLTSSDPAVIAFVNEKSPGWAACASQGSISGTVYAADGVTVITDALISVHAHGVSEGSSSLGTYVSQIDGSYTISGLAPGMYKVQVNNNREPGYVTKYYDDAPSWEGATIIEVLAGQTISNINFTLEPGGSISGTVFAADGVTVITDALISVHAHGVSEGSGSLGTYVSQTDGSYTISGLAPGIYKVQVNNNREPGYVSKYYDDTFNWDDATTIEVMAGQTTPNINFTLEPGASISGTVYQADGITPIDGARVYAMDTNFQYINDAYAGSDGSYQIYGLPSGNFYLAVQASGFGGVYYDNGYDDLTATLVTVTAPGVTPNIDFMLSPEASISGHVYQGDGVTPLAGAMVEVWPENGGQIRSATTNVGGEYTVGGLSTGSYVLHVSSGVYIQEYYNNAFTWFDATPISVTQPNVTSSINITLNQNVDTDGDGLQDLSDPCPSDPTNTCNSSGSTAIVIGAGGGTVSTPINDVTIVVPVSALPVPTTLTVTDGGDGFIITTDQGNVEVVLSKTIGPNGTTFNVPVAITLLWQDADDDGVVDGTSFNESSLYLSKDGVVIAGPCSTDTAHCNTTTNEFTIEVSSLSEFVIGHPVNCHALTLGHTGSGSDPAATPTHSTGCGTGSYTEGENISLSGAAPASGWQIGGWTGTANDGSTASTNTLAMPSNEHLVKVNYIQNYAPTDIALSNNSVAENQPAGTTVGALSSTDPDAGDIHAYSFACTVPGADDTSFQITGSNLKTTAIFDYETKNTYAICVRTEDNHGATFDKNFTINVTDTNDPPTGISLSNSSVAENQPTGTGVGTFTTVDQDPGDTHTYALACSTPGADDASFQITGSSLKTNAIFDYETKNSYAICVRTEDNHGATFDKNFTIHVSDINDPPTGISLSNSSVAENQPTGTGVGTFTTVDQDPGDTHTYALTCSTPGADDASFQITGSSLKTNAIFDYETKNTYVICVHTLDNHGATFDKNFTINVIDTNDPPTGISLSNSSVAENQATGTGVGTFTTVDQDPGDTHTYALACSTPGADDASFQITGSSLKTNAIFDYEAKNSYTICIHTNDGNGGTYDKNFTINVVDGNDVPTDISLSNLTVNENQPIGTVVGTLTTTDQDPGDTHTYALACPIPGVDDASFQITGSSLQTNAIFDYETKNTYAICVRTEDDHGGTYDEDFTITVTNVIEVLTSTFRSIGTHDGWILESGENSNVGGTINNIATTLRLGDDASKKQYRAILSFSTQSLPDTAVITKVTLKFKRQGVTGGGDPATIFKGLLTDIRKGTFGTAGLQAADFQAVGHKTNGPFTSAAVGGWYSINLTTAKAYINKLATNSGLTQIRLRFKLDDNNNGITNYLSLYSGNAGAASSPQLILEYYVP